MRIKFFVSFFIILFCFVEISFGQSLEEVKISKGTLTLTKSQDNIFRIEFNKTLLLEEQDVFGSIAEKFPAQNPNICAAAQLT